MAQHQAKPALDKVDPVWARIRREAEEVVRREPELATFIYSTILHHDTLEGAVVYRLAERLDHPALSGELIRQAYADALKDTPSIGESFRADIAATVDRDPATHRLLEPVLYYKGFPRHPDPSAGALALEQGPPRFRALPAEPLVGGVPVRHPSGRAHRARHLSRSRHRPRGRRDRGDRGRRVDAARRVRSAAPARRHEDRHPKIRYGVMIGAGAKILGNIEVGHCARIAAGSVVLKPVPNNVTVAGVPAKVVGVAGCPSPRVR
jgi:serine O-acetyltransferase